MGVTELVVRRLTLTIALSANWKGCLELTSLTDALQHYRYTHTGRAKSCCDAEGYYAHFIL